LSEDEAEERRKILKTFVFCLCEVSLNCYNETGNIFVVEEMLRSFIEDKRRIRRTFERFVTDLEAEVGVSEGDNNDQKVFVNGR
jgi:hypothetical protein